MENQEQKRLTIRELKEALNETGFLKVTYSNGEKDYLCKLFTLAGIENGETPDEHITGIVKTEPISYERWHRHNYFKR